MTPSLEQAKAIAQSGDFRRIPVSMELFADRFTTIEVLRTLRAASHHCFLLESAEDNQVWGRYSFLGYDPQMEITCRNGRLTIRTGSEDEAGDMVTSKTDNPAEAIRRILQDFRSPKLPGFPPFTGGLVGYFSYDTSGKIALEPASLTMDDATKFPTAWSLMFSAIAGYVAVGLLLTTSARS